MCQREWATSSPERKNESNRQIVRASLRRHITIVSGYKYSPISAITREILIWNYEFIDLGF